MECHKCPYSAEVAAGRAAGADFGSLPCAACRLDEGGGKIMVPYDDGKAVEEAPASEPEDRLMPVSVLGAAVRELLALPAESFEVMRLRYAGMSYHDIAKRLGYKRGGPAMVRMCRALNAHPVLANLFPRKAKSRLVRKERMRVLSRRAKVGGKGS